MSDTTQSGLSDNAAGGLAYLFIPAIIFLIVEPYNKNSYVRFHSWQSIILGVISIVVQIVLGMIPFVGWVILPFFALAMLVVWIICLVKAFGGSRFMLPIIGKYAEQQAGAGSVAL